MPRDLVHLGGTESTIKYLLNITRDNADSKENSLWTCLKLDRAGGGIFHSLQQFLFHLLLDRNTLADLYDTGTLVLCLFLMNSKTSQVSLLYTSKV